MASRRRRRLTFNQPDMPGQAGVVPLISNVSHLMLHTFTIRSELSVSAEHFWSTQSLASVNAELHPQYRMTAPPEILRAPLNEWDKQSNVLQSWILLRGLIPVDLHKFGTIEFTAPTAFVESSSSWLNRLWRHERTAGKTPGGCEVTDTISFQPRLALLGPLQKALYVLAFRHRHEVLRSLYVRAAGTCSRAVLSAEDIARDRHQP